MRKATQKTDQVSLGTKRACPKCSTKFYDFNKEELVCPKCDSKFRVDEIVGAAAAKLEPKRPPKKELPEEALMDAEDLVVGEAASTMESVDDLEDDEDEVVEDLDVDEDDKEEDY